jgi:hypothetical protein
MNKILSIAFVISLFTVTAVNPVFAATKASPSPTPTVAPPSDEETTENLKERIDSVLKSRTNQVKGVIDEMTLQKRGFIGEVDRVIEKTVTVKNLKGTEILTIDPTVVILRDNKKATIDDIAVGDWVIAIGYTNNQTFTLRRLLVSTTTLMPKTYETVIGTAKTVTKTQLTLTPRTDADPLVYQLNKDTHYEDDQAKTLKQTDIKSDSQYLVISYTNLEKKIATFIKSLAASIK